MKRNKVIILLLTAIFIWSMFPNKASADIGPKPSVVVDFSGLEGEVYYVTLLSSSKSTGPYSALNEDNKLYAHYQEGDEDYEIFQKFVSYQDKDSYNFLQYFEDCSDSHNFSWTYYPPREFKILIYFPQTDSFIVSDSIYERYAFDSYFTAQIAESNIVLERSYDYSGEIISLVVRIILTILIELAVALLFGFRERKFIGFIALVNLVTQIALNVALNIINYQSGAMAFVIFYVILELLIIIVEAILYNIYFKKQTTKEIASWKPTIYAITANGLSFALGMGLAYWIPGLF